MVVVFTSIGIPSNQGTILLLDQFRGQGQALILDSKYSLTRLSIALAFSTSASGFEARVGTGPSCMRAYELPLRLSSRPILGRTLWSVVDEDQLRFQDALRSTVGQDILLLRCLSDGLS